MITCRYNGISVPVWPSIAKRHGIKPGQEVSYETAEAALQQTVKMEARLLARLKKKGTRP